MFGFSLRTELGDLMSAPFVHRISSACYRCPSLSSYFRNLNELELYEHPPWGQVLLYYNAGQHQGAWTDQT
jgi:hypothetical protein